MCVRVWSESALRGDGAEDPLRCAARGADGPPLAIVNGYFSFAVTTDTRALSADIDLDDDASILRFLSAVQPLDRLRVDTRPGRGATCARMRRDAQIGSRRRLG